ncbi:DUF72 domain-containing protein [Arenimonas sp.]|uniref:DUF72 domain-containing protein n=1 Tax=Arenimonas sp. TaxID=1872635 RepID=UPI0039E22905
MAQDLFANESAAPLAHVGIGGWVYAPWRNNFYPPKLVQRRELEFASRHLTSIEVNGTYYGAQKPATYAKWRSETPDGFVFSLKAPGRITTRRDLAGAGGEIDAFVFGGLEEFGDRLGPILWQFEHGIRFDADAFAAFIDRLPAELNGRRLRHAVEVRDESFLCDRYFALMRRRGLPSVFTDSDKYPSFADLTGDFAYARLMRSRSTLPEGYTDAELDAWAGRVRGWRSGQAPTDLPLQQAPAEAKPREVFAYFISAAKERNPAAAMALARRLGWTPAPWK